MDGGKVILKERKVKVIGEAGYILNRQELVYLAAFTGRSSLLGVKDDTMLLTRDEILERWPDVKNSLYEKKYLNENSEGNISVNSRLFNCITVCANPIAYLSCTRHSGYFNCYFKKDICVKLEQSEYMTDTFMLTPITSYKSVKNYILDFFTPDGEFIINNSKLLFSERQYKNIKDRDFENIPKLKANDAAAKALQNEKALYSLVLFNLNNNTINRINVYEAYINENTIWSMLPDKSMKGTYVLESISKEKLSANLDGYINKLGNLFESTV